MFQNISLQVIDQNWTIEWWTCSELPEHTIEHGIKMLACLLSNSKLGRIFVDFRLIYLESTWIRSDLLLGPSIILYNAQTQTHTQTNTQSLNQPIGLPLSNAQHTQNSKSKQKISSYNLSVYVTVWQVATSSIIRCWWTQQFSNTINIANQLSDILNFPNIKWESDLVRNITKWIMKSREWIVELRLRLCVASIYCCCCCKFR